MNKRERHARMRSATGSGAAMPHRDRRNRSPLKPSRDRMDSTDAAIPWLESASNHARTSARVLSTSVPSTSITTPLMRWITASVSALLLAMFAGVQGRRRNLETVEGPARDGPQAWLPAGWLELPGSPPPTHASAPCSAGAETTRNPVPGSRLGAPAHKAVSRAAAVESLTQRLEKTSPAVTCRQGLAAHSVPVHRDHSRACGLLNHPAGRMRPIRLRFASKPRERAPDGPARQSRSEGGLR